MNFEIYQKFAKSTAIYPPESGIAYCALGLTSEAGEVAGKVKKWIRDGTPLNEVKSELGDVLWYVTNLGAELGWSLEDIVKANIEKLSRRKEKGTLSGSGDNR